MIQWNNDDHFVTALQKMQYIARINILCVDFHLGMFVYTLGCYHLSFVYEEKRTKRNKSIRIESNGRGE